MENWAPKPRFLVVFIIGFFSLKAKKKSPSEAKEKAKGGRKKKKRLPTFSLGPSRVSKKNDEKLLPRT